MSDYDPNKKHPQIPYKGKYPYLLVDQGVDGSQRIRSIQPGHESYFEVEPAGSYEGHGADGQQVNVTVHKKHEYGGDGHSSTYDGHTDSKTGATSRSVTMGSSLSETKSNVYQGNGGVAISASRNSRTDMSTGGDRSAVTKGDVTTDHTGDVHENVKGDVVRQVKGNRVDLIEGEYGVHNTSGSGDFKFEKGKFRLKAHDEIIIDSDTRIILRVGGVSVTIDPSTIKLLAQAIQMVKG